MQGKQGANWEEPYQIISEAGLGAFNLTGMDDKPFKWPWNRSNLKKFYQQKDHQKSCTTGSCNLFPEIQELLSPEELGY